MSTAQRVSTPTIGFSPCRLKLAEHACIANDVDVYYVGGFELGAYSLVSQYTYLCGATHDHEDVDFPLIPKPIVMHARAWVAADVYVAPGVTIGEGTVVGARSSVFGDLPAWQVCVGTPAKPVKARVLGPDDY